MTLAQCAIAKTLGSVAETMNQLAAQPRRGRVKEGITEYAEGVVAAPIVQFRIDFAECSSIGPGKICLLEAIRDSGSL